MQQGKTKLSFGFSSVNAGQRATSHEPQFIAVSTEGGFRITPPVSAVLNIQHGEYVMFINNVQNIDLAITERDETVVAFCEENGLELGSPEAYVAIHKEFDMWAIAKGIVEKDPKGNARTMSERLTKADRVKFVTANYEAMLEGAKEQGDDELKEALGREDITKDEVIDLLCPFVTPKELDKLKGSKVANPGGQTGAGTSLTFTDSNVWNQLKSDLGDEAGSVNRVFEVNPDEVIKLPIHDGYEMVEVYALILGEYTDQEPARIGKKEEDAE